MPKTNKTQDSESNLVVFTYTESTIHISDRGLWVGSRWVPSRKKLSWLLAAFLSLLGVVCLATLVAGQRDSPENEDPTAATLEPRAVCLHD